MTRNLRALVLLVILGVCITWVGCSDEPNPIDSNVTVNNVVQYDTVTQYDTTTIVEVDTVIEIDTIVTIDTVTVTDTTTITDTNTLVVIDTVIVIDTITTVDTMVVIHVDTVVVDTVVVDTVWVNPPLPTYTDIYAAAVAIAQERFSIAAPTCTWISNPPMSPNFIEILEGPHFRVQGSFQYHNLGQAHIPRPHGYECILGYDPVSRTFSLIDFCCF